MLQMPSCESLWSASQPVLSSFLCILEGHIGGRCMGFQVHSLILYLLSLRPVTSANALFTSLLKNWNNLEARLYGTCPTTKSSFRTATALLSLALVGSGFTSSLPCMHGTPSHQFSQRLWFSLSLVSVSIYPTIGVSYDRMGLGEKFGKKLRDKATKAKRPVPSLAFVRRFHCTISLSLLWKILTRLKYASVSSHRTLKEKQWF